MLLSLPPPPRKSLTNHIVGNVILRGLLSPVKANHRNRSEFIILPSLLLSASDVGIAVAPLGNAGKPSEGQGDIRAMDGMGTGGQRVGGVREIRDATGATCERQVWILPNVSFCPPGGHAWTISEKLVEKDLFLEKRFGEDLGTIIFPGRFLESFETRNL